MNMPKYFPAFLNLQGMPCLVVGGGDVAERNVTALLECDAKVTLISPKITPRLADIAKHEMITWLCREYNNGDTAGFCVVISATNHIVVNNRVAKECKEAGILVNVVDDLQNCGFLAPAVVRRGDLVIAVSTGGASPLVARKIREDLYERYGPEYVEYLEILSKTRAEVLHNVPDPVIRRKVFEQLTDGHLVELIRDGQVDDAKEWVKQCLSLQ